MSRAVPTLFSCATLLALLRREDSPPSLYTSPVRFGLRLDLGKGYARSLTTMNGFGAGAIGTRIELGFYL